MENLINKAYKIYKFCFVLGFILYCLYIFVDDYNLISEYWQTELVTYLGIWLLYLVIYSITFTILFWTPTVIGLFIYYKFIFNRKAPDLAKF
ncbi:hypothetical protein [Seonamhaeicola marinus]|uniref:Uncharacterized protein n=1 Tax=Seonamhaeicola marinus TaxID=1912246 RepID=A0A5D0JEL6_9FLAO|nr:hypothetical protein [Seonamhaeicola marinus]TYA94763.1 hypothetical protein FUA24_00820 [Seonamhaeicola marinus]